MCPILGKPTVLEEWHSPTSYKMMRDTVWKLNKSVNEKKKGQWRKPMRNELENKLLGYAEHSAASFRFNIIDFSWATSDAMSPICLKKRLLSRLLKQVFFCHWSWMLRACRSDWVHICQTSVLCQHCHECRFWAWDHCSDSCYSEMIRGTELMPVLGLQRVQALTTQVWNLYYYTLFLRAKTMHIVGTSGSAIRQKDCEEGNSHEKSENKPVAKNTVETHCINLKKINLGGKTKETQKWCSMEKKSTESSAPISVSDPVNKVFSACNAALRSAEGGSTWGWSRKKMEDNLFLHVFAY